MIKRKLSKRLLLKRRVLKKISWILAEELPFWGWYDCETDEIPLVVDNFVKSVWKAFSEKTFTEFTKVVVDEINYLLLHEMVHHQAQPASETGADVFPEDKSKSLQENLRSVERKVDLCAMLLAGKISRFKGIVIIELKNCESLQDLEKEIYLEFS